tara:strand:- start:291 stop:1481 length:1191 start_codon:yes stop_codon:yes gene_type:complete
MSPLRLLIATVCLLLCGHAYAGVINVPQDYVLIQEAVDASSNGDIIKIAPGTYYEHQIETGNRSIAIVGATNGNGSQATVIDANGLGSVFLIEASLNTFLVLENLRIVNGDSYDGGGVDSSKCNIHIVNCDISNNFANRGGGIWSTYGSLHLEDCLLANNTSTDSGGGIRKNDGSLIISRSEFSGNFAQGSGGGIHTSDVSEVLIEASIFTENVSNTFGGGSRFRNGSKVMIDDCAYLYNTARFNGGAIDYRSLSLQISNSNLSHNTSENYGGGIYADSSVLLLSNCLVQRNSSTFGGGIYAEDQWQKIGLLSTEICSNVPDQIDAKWEGLGSTVMEHCPYCSGDASGDGFIDVNDILYVLSTWGSDDANADFDENGLINVDDVLILLSNFGSACP